MKRFFGRKKKDETPQGPSLEETSGNMDKRSEILRQKILQCDDELRQIKEQIKQSRGNSQVLSKQRAIQVMKRKRMYTQQYETLMGQQFNVDQVRFAQESIQDTLNTVNAMKTAVAVQKQTLKQMKIGELDNLMDDMADMMEDTEEINEIMSRNYGVEIDEDDLDAELAEFDDEILTEQLSRSSVQVPSYLPTQRREEEQERELMNLPSPP